MTKINRRTALKQLGLGATALAVANPVKGAPGLRKNRRPNVLLLVSDQERSGLDLPGSLDLPGHERLRQRGTSFNNYHVNTSPCSPSRSVMYTGQHTMHTHMTANLHAPPFPALNDKLKTLGHHFRDQGYYTAYKGKWHLSDIEDGPGLLYGNYPSRNRALESHGFSDYNLTGDVHGSVWQGYIADRMVTAEACRWLMSKGQTEEKPWFLAVNFVNPHDIMFFSTGEKQSRSRTNPQFMAPLRPAPHDPVYAKDWSHISLPASFRASLDNKPWCQQAYAKLIDSVYGHIDKNNEAAWLANQSYYFNCLRDVSRQVDQVLQALEQSGQADNTIIVYTADHGEMAGAHGLRQKGPFAYKENSRVPLIISHPDARQQRDVDNIGSSVDLVPTLLSLATGGKVETQTPGTDLSAALEGRPSDRDSKGHLFAYGVTLYTDPEITRALVEKGDEITPIRLMTEAFSQLKLGPALNNRGLHRGCFDGRYKFIRYFSPDSHHRPADWATLMQNNDLELYDTHMDPDELDNLAAKPQQHKALLLSMNEKTNALIDHEIGEDNGGEFPGPTFLYQL